MEGMTMTGKGDFCLTASFLCVSVCPLAAADAGARRIELTSPNGGEQWSADSQHYVTWCADPACAKNAVRIEYTSDGGGSWHEIAAAAPNTGKFLWQAPAAPSDECRMRVTDTVAVATDESDAAFSIGPSQRVSDYKWIEMTGKAAFAPRDGAGALTFKGRMWLLGGWNPGDKAHFPKICNNEVWSSVEGADWRLEKPNTFAPGTFDPEVDWEGRHTAGYVLHRGKMWIVGGDANQGYCHTDVWSSADGRRWECVNRNVPWGPRGLHYTVAFKDRIWVMGGQTLPQFAPAEEAFHNDVWSSADGVTWTKVEPNGPVWSPRGMVGGSVVFQDRIWLLGGGTYDTPQHPQRKFFNEVWCTADGATWERRLGSAPWHPRQYHDVGVFDGRMWVFEGWNRSNRNDAWYSADGVNWYELPGTPWKPRHAASVFVHDNALWMVAGNNMESDVWKLVRTSAGP